uniref:PH domain-containing protein n=1 Tax=Globisporangium ultimum (strain ATCC 200006 / CBS 805.95 / DAOM BR144) TaxID=431595 RepID=K3WX28_GLOUD
MPRTPTSLSSPVLSPTRAKASTVGGTRTLRKTTTGIENATHHPPAGFPGSPAYARAKTTVVHEEQNENASGNDLPFEDIAMLLTSSRLSSASVEQVKPKLKVSASGKFEDQFYHAHEGSRAMGKLKNRAYLKKVEKSDSSKKSKKNVNVNGKDVEQFSDSDIIYSGYLVKQGSYWKTWRRRYFILRRDTPVLSYYDSAEELTKLGEITVDATTTVKPTPREGFPFQFVVEHEKRKLTLVAEEGKPSTDAWISHLLACIQRRANEAANARQSMERKSIGMQVPRLSENGSVVEELPNFRKDPRDNPYNEAPLDRFRGHFRGDAGIDRSA